MNHNNIDESSRRSTEYDCHLVVIGRKHGVDLCGWTVKGFLEAMKKAGALCTHFSLDMPQLSSLSSDVRSILVNRERREFQNRKYPFSLQLKFRYRGPTTKQILPAIVPIREWELRISITEFFEKRQVGLAKRMNVPTEQTGRGEICTSWNRWSLYHKGHIRLDGTSFRAPMSAIALLDDLFLSRGTNDLPPQSNTWSRNDSHKSVAPAGTPKYEVTP